MKANEGKDFMNIKTGIDIIEVNRIKENIEKFGDKFLNRVFTEKEIEYCESKKVQKFQSYSGRFAAKEAIFKALSDNIDNKFEIEWKDIEIVNDKNGRPHAHLNGKLANFNCKIDVSISHIQNMAISNAIAMFE